MKGGKMKRTKIPDNSKIYFYAVFRILIGFMFMLHGGQKLFGWFGGPGGNGSVALTSIYGFAGIIELIGGLFILLGLFTSIAALISAFNMIGAWIIVHIPKGFIPLTNGGELAALYFAAFLVLIAYGAQAWSLEKILLKKEFMH